MSHGILPVSGIKSDRRGFRIFRILRILCGGEAYRCWNPLDFQVMVRLMRPFTMLPLIFLATLPACTVIQGSTPSGGRYTYATLGGDASNLDLAPEGTKAGTVETAPSFREVASVTKTAVVVPGLVDGTNAITGAVKSVKNAKTAADVTKHGATTAVEEQRIAADLAKSIAETNAQGGFAE